MTASHPRKSDRRTRCLSTGRDRARPDIRLSSQIARQLTGFDATRRSSSSRFTVHRLAGAPRLHSPTSSAALKSPIAHAAPPTCPPAVSSLGGLRTPAPVRAAPPSWGRHPQTFTKSEVETSGCQVCFTSFTRVNGHSQDGRACLLGADGRKRLCIEPSSYANGDPLFEARSMTATPQPTSAATSPAHPSARTLHARRT